MNEADYIGNTLSCIRNQLTTEHIKLYVCVNQPEFYRNQPEKMDICENNAETIKILENCAVQNLTIIDKTSENKGWSYKKHGVGIARKTLMDFIALDAQDDDIVISLDADTTFNPDYFQSITDQFEKYPKAVAISVPYYHKLTNKLAEDHAILRYEIYMRNYAIQMLSIDSPFAFTALGSALAYRIKAYKAIGGMSPMKSGEDFYFLQQLRKYGSIIISNKNKVYPAARFSNRVFFGTGPAMIKGATGDWSSYPIYHKSLFKEVEKVYQIIDSLYTYDIDEPFLFLEFLKQQFGDDDFLTPIRQNYKTLPQFVRAFHTKADGLRILQFLKKEQLNRNIMDKSALFENYPELKSINSNYTDLVPLEQFEIEHLSQIREYLVTLETSLITQKQILS